MNPEETERQQGKLGLPAPTLDFCPDESTLDTGILPSRVAVLMTHVSFLRHGSADLQLAPCGELFPSVSGRS